jgi:hypothetical protein
VADLAAEPGTGPIDAVTITPISPQRRFASHNSARRVKNLPLTRGKTAK